ncbi:type I polyketide synthase [Janthinobacterium lividum]|uniref:type I polyketide synthase n=1 Tax=Janthinobacterium lividum TaxID=29581 RepID=UPI00087492C4|nr:type I polyketide synthase [Janthinobacterium lividum]MCC7716672.1 SDR family NAD(P)-dependent oxidoreductase [Janthinobacterium lividum]OEZ51799.1 phthiocerol/phenolphthiocerol synthesis polyketide synthase type I PpsA [Janthinobacterium lividum]WQE31743.1 SDR family NAD(P)-dependent oxidoreductase [Janthinobacterium lividum]STS86013.1 Beta-ketoacyl-acyl-carrier-protein synthase I [Janthinobacterium lividum]
MTEANKDLLLQSIKTIRQLSDKLAAYEQREQCDIAIIGIACRFPGGVDGVHSYWDLLSAGRSGVAEVGQERWSNRQFVDPDYAATGKLVTPYAGMLEKIYDFDAEFFGMSAIEAENLDPQQRLLLEQSWLALEDAGIEIGRLRGSDTGVFVGIGSQDYGMALLADAQHANAYVASGNSPSMAAGRLSYFYDFTGPSMSIDTACSSSLVAVHEACRKLRQGDCGMALAAGVNALLTPHTGMNLSRARMLTTQRDCHVFDARADGYVRSEGCAVLVLKRLHDALADGDRIHALIKSVAINHDGHSSGLTVPNGSAQEAVIRAALRQAGLAPGDISYVEAHGTGTRLGDPIEARALAAVFGEGHDVGHPLQVGAVKANLGHLEAAAGIAGLIKAALVVGHGEAPPQPGFEQLNPKIDWNHEVFRIARQHTPLAGRSDGPLCAGVSSFGFSGTNAHAIVAAPPMQPAPPIDAGMPDNEFVLALSAKSPRALQLHVEDTISYLRTQPATALAAISHTSTQRRVPLGERIAVTGRSADGLAHALRSGMAARDSARRRSRIVLFLSCHDDPGCLEGLAGQTLMAGSGTRPLSSCAEAHRGLLALLSSFGVFPGQVILQGIEAAHVRAWLTGVPAPAGLPYFTGDEGLVLVDADVGLSPDPAKDRSTDPITACQQVMVDAVVLGQCTPPLALPPSAELQVLGSPAQLRRALAVLFTCGADIAWSALQQQGQAVAVDFPRRRFERKTFKSQSIAMLLNSNGCHEERIHPLVRSKILQPDGKVAYALDLSVPWLDFIDQHKVQGRRLLPGSLLIDLIRRLAGDVLGGIVPTLAAVGFHHPVDIDLPRRDYLLVVQPGKEGVEAVMWSRELDTPELSWIRHASATCLPEIDRAAPADVVPADGLRKLDLTVLYTRLQASGVELGKDFRCVKELRMADDQLEGQLALDEASSFDPLARMAILLDGCFQSSAVGSGAEGIYLLAAIGEVSLAERLPSALRVRLLRKESADGYRFDIVVADVMERPLGSLTDVFFKRLPGTSLTNGPIAPSCFYAQRWQLTSWPLPPVLVRRPDFVTLPELLGRCEPSATWGQRYGLADYNAYRQRVEQACEAVISEVLGALGWRAEDASPQVAMERCGIVPAQRRLFEHLSGTLARVDRSGDAAPEAQFVALLENYPRYRSETQFLQRCTTALAEVLTGKRDPLDVLFGGASMTGSEAVYIESPISLALNGQLAQVTATLGKDRPLRILEIGAGTGGTSRCVLDALRDTRVETYCYTDISPLFLERARGMFGKHAFIEYRLLDIEQPVAGQHVDPGTFDIVIAANVLHATRLIGQTLRNVRDLLAPGGYLLLRECTQAQLSADLSFGMTEGWWRFEDSLLRPDYPVLRHDQWEQQLSAQGFDAVCSLLPDALSAESLIVAQAGRSARAERWLVIHDGQGRECVELLEHQGMACIDLSWHAALAPDSVPLDVSFDYLVCFPGTAGAANADLVPAAQEIYESMIAFCRQWLGSEATRQARMWCVTTHAERVDDSDRLAGLAQSVMTGVLKCAALEYPGRIGGAVDLQGEAGDIARVLAHIRQPGSLRYLAVRGGLPYVPKLLPMTRYQQTLSPADVMPVSLADGTVLITGGLGGIGYALARALAPRVDALILVGRRIGGEAQQARLQALRGLGARVEAVQADVADPVQVAALFARLHAGNLPIDHLVHAAGVGGDRLLSDSERGDLCEVVDAKLAATWYLHIQAPRELKSFLVLTTMVGLWGAKQKAHYVLANHFADRVVQLRRAQGLAASLVQLGPVDSGMLEAEGKNAALRVGVRSFDVNQLATLLSEPLPLAESALLDIDWARLKTIYRSSWLEGFFDQVGTGASARPVRDQHVATDFLGEYAALPPAQREAFLERQLFELLGGLLGIGGDIASYLHTGFHDLGMDSLLTMSFAEKLSAHTGQTVSSVDIFDNANLARLRGWLASRLRQGGGEPATNEKAVPAAQPPQCSGEVNPKDIEAELRAMQALLEDI